MVKQVNAVLFILALTIACSNRKGENSTQETPDSTEFGEASEASAPTTTLTHPDTALVAQELFSQEGETALEISSKKLPVTNPYNFELDVAKLKSILGPATVVEAEDVASTNDYPGYTMYTVTATNAELKFGKNTDSHFAEIRTRALPLKNGIVVGMPKSSFIQKMSIESPEALKATLYKLYDDYGYMSFYFKADTLNLIRISYEEGD